jgi:transposase
MSSAVYTSKRLDHLGLVAGFFQEIDLAAIIDKALGTSERRQVGYGHIFTAMLLNGLGFTGRKLHIYNECFDDKPVSRRIGEWVEALEHTIREQLKAQDEYFPDMKKKPTQTPTARWGLRVLICLRLMSSKRCS